MALESTNKKMWQAPIWDLTPIWDIVHRNMACPNLGRLDTGIAKMTSETEQTLSVPEAGKRYFGLGRGGSYEAARRGDIPYVQVGRLKRVPVRTLEAMLDAVKPSAGRHD
jgi:hypothetical protein